MKGSNYFSGSRIREVEQKIRSLLKKRDRYKTGDPEQIFLETSDLMLLFGVSGRVVRYWRDKAVLECVRRKGRSYFKLSEVMRMLERHRFP